MPENEIEYAHLPINEEAIKKGLEYIRFETPEYLFYYEDGYLQTEQPDLSRALFEAEGIDDPSNYHTPRPTAFREGAVWTWMMMKFHESEVGVKFPSISYEAYMAFAQDIADLREHTREYWKVGEKPLPEDSVVYKVIGDMHRDLRDSDYYLYQGLDEISKYRAERQVFWSGVFSLYMPVRKVIEAKFLEDKFKL